MGTHSSLVRLSGVLLVFLEPTVMLVSSVVPSLYANTLITPTVFCAGQAIIGFGLASFLMTSLIVVQEISHPRSRSVVAASWVRVYLLYSYRLF